MEKKLLFDQLLFDLDGTLFDFARSEREAFTLAMDELGAKPTAEMYRRYSAINAQLWEEFELGLVSKDALQQQRFTMLFYDYGLAMDGQLANARYLHYLSQSGLLLPDAEEVCRTLAEQLPLYLVTNGVGATQRGRIAVSGIGQYFKGVFISEEIGVPKPDRRYFDAVFAAIGDVDRSRTLIVGDSLSSDMRGGNNAGIATCWYNPAGLPCPQDIHVTFEIRSLKDLSATCGSVAPTGNPPPAVGHPASQFRK